MFACLFQICLRATVQPLNNNHQSSGELQRSHTHSHTHSYSVLLSLIWFKLKIASIADVLVHIAGSEIVVGNENMMPQIKTSPGFDFLFGGIFFFTEGEAPPLTPKVEKREGHSVSDVLVAGVFASITHSLNSDKSRYNGVLPPTETSSQFFSRGCRVEWPRSWKTQ